MPELKLALQARNRHGRQSARAPSRR